MSLRNGSEHRVACTAVRSFGERPRASRMARAVGITWLFLVWLCALTTYAVEPTERERELLRMMERMEERISALEKLEERVRTLERKYGGGEPGEETELEERVAKLEEGTERQASPGTPLSTLSDGLNFESTDHNLKLKIGGRIENDWAFMTEDDDIRDAIDDFEEGTEFRRARLFVSGQLYDRVEYKAQYDFADDGGADFKDVYLGIHPLPIVGNLRIGQFKEPFSLEQLTSSNYGVTFMERSLMDSLVPGRNTGLMLFDDVLEQHLTWAAGVFRDSDDFGDRSDGTGGGEYNFTGRITANPWYEANGEKLVHLGAAYSFRKANDDTVRYRSSPEANLAPDLIDTRELVADEVNLIGAEAALDYGPASLQCEYVLSDVNATDVDNPAFHGWYANASYFLTGEHRPYNRSHGTFGSRLIPKNNFLDGAGGLGAWEIATRYSRLDLDDGGIDGGELADITLGLNWHLNPNTRVMWDYIHSELDRDILGLIDEDADILQMRFHVDF